MTQQKQGAVTAHTVERANNPTTDEIQVGHALLVANEDDIGCLDDTYGRESIAR